MEHSRLRVPVLAVVTSLCLLALALPNHAQEVPPPGPDAMKDRLAPFVPSPMKVVEEMLKLAGVTKTDRVYDLGSGDGRIVIMAAEKFGAEAVGIELDETLVAQSRARIKELKLENRARILHGNIYEADLSKATVVTLYLLTSVNERLKPVLEKRLRPGTRVVSHDFQVPGWEPKETVHVTSEAGVTHTIHLYVR
jgi:SAM-dependent methyltransferase